MTLSIPPVAVLFSPVAFLPLRPVLCAWCVLCLHLGQSSPINAPARCIRFLFLIFFFSNCSPARAHCALPDLADSFFHPPPILLERCIADLDPLTLFPTIGYNTKGERLVAGIVPLTPDQNYVLLIQSTRRKGWVLPKGGWESDETCQEAAEREAWEEAGIAIQINYDLGDIEEKRAQKSSKDRSRYHFFEGTVTSEYEEWPEKHKRERQWFTFTQAWEALTTRPELQEALNRCTMNRL